MARVLIVENETFFIKALVGLLIGMDHTSVLAKSGLEARAILELEDFDCVISEAKLACLSGLDLPAWIRENKPTPLVITSILADQTHERAPFGIREVTLLAKPFFRESVQAALTAAISPDRWAANEGRSDDALVPVPRSLVREGAVVEVSLYHYLEGRPKLLLQQGATIHSAVLDSGSKTRLYTDRKSLAALMANSMTLIDSAASNPKIEPKKRALLIQDMLAIINEQMASLGLEKGHVVAAEEMLTTYLKSVDSGAVWAMIANLDAYSRPIYAQTLAVTMVCLLVAHDLKYTAQDCFMLTTAALFHDIGLITIDKNLIKTPRALLNMKDRITLEKHVEIGVVLLRKSEWIGAEVCNIIWQHHENASGNGYPRALKQSQIHPMAALIRLADEFCTSVIKTAGAPGVPPLRAIDLLRDRRELDQKFVVALRRILNQSLIRVPTV